MDNSFTGPVLTSAQASPESPRALINARSVRGGFVRSLREGSASGDTITSAPIIRWPAGGGGELLQRDLGVIDGADRGTLLDVVRRGNRLYASIFDAAGNPRTIFFKSDYSGNWSLTNQVQQTPAMVTAINVYPTQQSTGSAYEIVDGGTTYGPFTFHVGYRLVPISATGEAGPVIELTAAVVAQTGSVADASVTDLFFIPDFFPTGPDIEFEVEVTPETARIEVYKTVPFHGVAPAGALGGWVALNGVQCGEVGGATAAANSPDDNVLEVPQLPLREDWYRLGIFDAVTVGAGRSVTVTDEKQFVTADVAALLDLANSPLASYEIATGLYDRDPNLHFALHDLGAGTFAYRGFNAQQLARDSVRTLYGNVTYAARAPSFYYFEGGGTTDTTLQFEYQVGGVTYYGPTTVLANCKAVKVPVAGAEAALLVYTDDGAGTQRLKYRLTPENGYYVLPESPSFFEAKTSLIFGQAQSDSSAQVVQSATTYIPEPLTVLRSANNRPWELLADGFNLDDGVALRLLSELTVPQAEATQVHDLISATGSAISVHTWISAGEAYNTRPVTSTAGVKLSADGLPVFARCRDFGVLVGTDDRLYRITPGARLDTLDDEIPGLLGSIEKLAYHASINALMILSDTGLWGFFFERDFVGVRLQYDYPYGSTDGKASEVWYDEDAGETLVLLYGAGDVATATHLDESGDELAASLITQRYNEGTQTGVAYVRADFDEGVRASTGEDVARVGHAVRNPSVQQVDDPAYPGGAGRAVHVPLAPNRDRHLSFLFGVGHQLRFDNFSELRRVYVKWTGARGT